MADWQNYYLSDSRIRLKANAIHFYDDSYFWESGGGPCSGTAFQEGASAAALAQHPELANTVLIHLIGNWGCVQSIDPVTGQPNYANGAALPPYWSLADWGKPSQLVLRGTQNTTWGLSDATYHAHILAHELGHVLGLKHTYAFGGEATATVQADFLGDIYSCYQQTDASNPWCPVATTTCPQGPGAWQLCPQNGASSCNPWSNPFDDCTNNMMALYWGRFISNQQMGRMHRSLMLTNASKSAEGYNAAPFTPFFGLSETWVWPMKFYQDIHIKSGQTLTIKCQLQMVGDARIVVEAGGRLIVDGGKITNAMYDAPNGYFNQPWRGIEVWGWSGAPQEVLPSGNFANHGLVEIINGGVVENAQTGVYLGRPGDPTLAGGVLRMAGTIANPPGVIRDCRTGIRFDPYRNEVWNSDFSALTELNNRSTFIHARFEWTEDFDNIHGSNNPVALADLNGVRVCFWGCAFAHSGQYPQYSSQLGYGIKAHNSTVWVNTACPNGTINCPAASQLPCTFTGLDHGVHATASTTLPRLTVHRAQFTSNVCGVYGEGLRNALVRNCSFNVGDRAVTLDNFPVEFYWGDHHRGIFFTHCNGLRVMNNTLTEASEPAAPTEGIVIGYTNTASESIRSNTASGMDRGYVGEGVSANTGNPAAIGLQFLCNTNNANGWNIWSRQAQGASPLELPQHTIRLNQGWQNVPALNYLDNGVSSALDIRVSTQSLITYWQVSAPHYAPTTVQGLVAPTLSGPQVLYGCPIIISGATDQLALQGEIEQARQAYAGLRFLYSGLIDGGSTDVVLNEIADAWPQDYWDLRAYLLSNSPYLSVDVIKEAMEKEGFPDAMRAEICIANPEATQKEGFLKWLETECSQPLPEALLEAIEASWEVKTYRATLEMQMGQEHARMSEAAYTLAELVAADDEENGTDQAEELAALQALRTVETRYDEALLLLGRGQHAQARALITALPGEHALKGKQVDERAHMLWYIDFLEAVHANGRTPAQLTEAEVAQMQAFVADRYDRPTQWASHLLCYHYGICRSPYTGDAGAEPKSRGRRPVVAAKEQARLGIKPNPANAWVVFTCELPDLIGEAQLVVRDMIGREAWRAAIGRGNGQVLMDTRSLPSGTYAAEVVQNGQRLLPAERLIIQP